MARDPAFHGWLKRSVARGDAFCVRIRGEFAGAMQFREGRINWLAVHGRLRRRGVGRALVAYAVAAGEGQVRVTTFGRGHAHADSGAARALYSTMGFRPSDEAAEPAIDGTPREVLVWRGQ